VLRASAEPVVRNALDNAWPDVEQRERALGSLIADGLVVHDPPHSYRLPG
jgi:A/G-specific adenine glycosylase